MTEIVEMGMAGSSDEPISYEIGPSQAQRMLSFIVSPSSLGATSFALSALTMLGIVPASEIGDIHLFAGAAADQISVYRWSAGIRMGLAAAAVLLALVGLRLLIGRRPRLVLDTADSDASGEELDALEAAALAEVSEPPARAVGLLGGAVVVGLISTALNAIAFGYAMSQHVHPSSGLGF